MKAGTNQIKINTGFDIMPTIDKWARRKKFIQFNRNNSEIEYLYIRRAIIIEVYGVHVIIRNEGNFQYTIETWMQFSLFIRLFFLFLIPERIKIDKIGFFQYFSRLKARRKVNALLRNLKQAPL
ncbi:MAG: hypothetical protein K8S16_08420 [Bacteroidales bacterium]|nr:hypothetical protein [Bacteroidales bacterium]